MPKAKADQVVTHRIEFQDSERELLSSLSAAYAFNRVASPIVKLLNDVTGTVTVLALLGASGLIAGVTFTYIYDPEALTDPIEQFMGQLAEARDRAELIGEAASRGPLWGLIDLIEMATGSNLPDFGGGFENPVDPVQQNPDYNDPSDLYLGLDAPTYTSPADVWGGGLGSGSLAV
jgi:hypothetical protein